MKVRNYKYFIRRVARVMPLLSLILLGCAAEPMKHGNVGAEQAVSTRQWQEVEPDVKHQYVIKPYDEPEHEILGRLFDVYFLGIEVVPSPDLKILITDSKIKVEDVVHIVNEELEKSFGELPRNAKKEFDPSLAKNELLFRSRYQKTSVVNPIYFEDVVYDIIVEIKNEKEEAIDNGFDDALLRIHFGTKIDAQLSTVNKSEDYHAASSVDLENFKKTCREGITKAKQATLERLKGKIEDLSEDHKFK